MKRARMLGVLLFLTTLQTASAFYDPAPQRWLNRDPIGERGGNNLFAFVKNHSTTHIDPRGLSIAIHGDGPYQPDDYRPSRPDPPANNYPHGFAICQRDINPDGSFDCSAGIANLCGGQHTYIQHVDDEYHVWGYGWAGGATKPRPESDKEPNSCQTCTKGKGKLMYGYGAGQTGEQAEDSAIQECISKVKPSKPYSPLGYNCKSWAKEAAKNCGLDCK